MRTKCWSDERYQIETITVRYAARLRNQHHCSCLQSIIYPRLVGTLYMNWFVFQRSILESTLSFFSSRRSDPRGIIEYRDLDAPDDGDIFWGCAVGGGDLIVGAYIIKDSFARLVDSNVVSYSDVADNFYYQILELMHFC